MALAGRLLDGGQFGKDIMDMNPPHVWWISTVPVLFARQTGLRPDVAATAFTVAMAILSLAAVAHLIAAAGFTRVARNLFLVFAALLVLFVPGYDFGQREHWMVLLTLPYIVACGCRLHKLVLPPLIGVAIGVAACLGFCIKPYFLLVPVALEIWILVRLRRPSLAIRPETIAMRGYPETVEFDRAPCRRQRRQHIGITPPASCCSIGQQRQTSADIAHRSRNALRVCEY